VLLVGYEPAQVATSGLLELLGPQPITALAGGHDAMGVEKASLDEAGARRAIEAQRDRVSAFAVSALFGVRNPDHELRVRELAVAMTGKPVTCGHELASSLGAPRRALTVALNAGMIPHVQQLIEAVEQILARLEVDAPLMMVKGDGSLIGARMALRQPVGTVLSGPAASVVGACALTGLRDAVVADMGGTTTDIAVISDGSPRLDAKGALIGDWRPMVDAVQVYSIGLGGDSEVRFSGGEGLRVGPRRVVPVSLLAYQYPQVLPWLERQLQAAPNARHNKIALRLQRDEALLAQLTDRERTAWELLAEQPLELDRVVGQDRALARALGRLERKGLVIYSGFTPSDAAHVLGLSRHWSRAGAVLAAGIWARQMRWLYGYGSWGRGDVAAPSREVLDLVIRTICHKLIEAGLNDHGRLTEARSKDLAGLLTEMIVDGRQGGGGNPLFGLRFAAGRAVVAVGAPASCYYPEVASRLGVDLRIPAHAEVANAVGAVMGSVVQRVHITVTQPVRGTFRVYTKQGPSDFGELQPAVEHAERIASAEAVERAREAGAESVVTRVSREDNSVDHDIDGFLFFDARITVTASGRPRLQA
jgi:N-methylhydantoinase A/oxoprolinase/acetone carboxylase beta subunit